MPRLKDNTFITFNDGELDICEVKNRNITKTKRKGIRYGNQTVGIKRFWQAKVASATVDRLVAIPWMKGVSTMDICIIEEIQYKIVQVQEKADQYPPCLLLSLEKNSIKYKEAE